MKYLKSKEAERAKQLVDKLISEADFVGDEETRKEAENLKVHLAIMESLCYVMETRLEQFATVLDSYYPNYRRYSVLRDRLPEDSVYLLYSEDEERTRIYSGKEIDEFLDSAYFDEI
jgi:hypothetical protein